MQSRIWYTSHADNSQVLRDWHRFMKQDDHFYFPLKHLNNNLEYTVFQKAVKPIYWKQYNLFISFLKRVISYYNYYLIHADVVLVDKGKAVKDARANFILKMHCNISTRISNFGYFADLFRFWHGNLITVHPMRCLPVRRLYPIPPRENSHYHVLHKRGKWPTEW